MNYNTYTLTQTYVDNSCSKHYNIYACLASWIRLQLIIYIYFFTLSDNPCFVGFNTFWQIEKHKHNLYPFKISSVDGLKMPNRVKLQ